MLRIFIGYDHRQPISYNVLQYSILKYASEPVAITPLVYETVGIKRCGLTPFTFTRFVIPYLCDYRGWAVFMDADMILKSDIKKLFDMKDERYRVMVVKSKKKFEHASLMLFNCEKCKHLIPEYIEKAEGLHLIDWAKEEEIGGLPPEWNVLVGYDKYREDAKLVHYTQGVPCFPETFPCDYSNDWHALCAEMNSAYEWSDLMGKSVHACKINNKFMPKFLMDEEKKCPKPEYEEHVRSLLEETA
jgi:hypothetical protein